MQQKPYIILASTWKTNKDACMGIVAVETFADEWKAYIGIVSGHDERADEQYVATWGAPLLPAEAHGFFPRLDITKYKQEGAG